MKEFGRRDLLCATEPEHLELHRLELVGYAINHCGDAGKKSVDELWSPFGGKFYTRL
jgi:hypothetical protein